MSRQLDRRVFFDASPYSSLANNGMEWNDTFISLILESILNLNLHRHIWQRILWQNSSAPNIGSDLPRRYSIPSLDFESFAEDGA